jgi:hypothetical protein
MTGAVRAMLAEFAAGLIVQGLRASIGHQDRDPGD